MTFVLISTLGRSSAFQRRGFSQKSAPARLPSHLKPSFYEIRLMPHIDPANDDWRIEGYVNIHITAVNNSLHGIPSVISSRNITLHSMEIDGITTDTVNVTRVVNSGGQDRLTVTEVTFEPEHDFLIIHLEDDLIPGDEYSVEIKFLATLNDKLLGFYRSKYSHRGTERSE